MAGAGWMLIAEGGAPAVHGRLAARWFWRELRSEVSRSCPWCHVLLCRIIDSPLIDLLYFSCALVQLAALR